MSVIINADDFGMSDSVNEAIIKCFIDKYINRTTIMVNMPAFESACELSRKHDVFDKIGLHLNLTEGIAITEGAKKIDLLFSGKSNFNKFCKLNGGRFSLNNNIKEIIRAEISAQMDKYINIGFPLMHIDSHHHVHMGYPILSIVISEASKRGFKSMRICHNLHLNSLKSKIKISYFNNKIAEKFTTTRYFGRLDDYLFEYKRDIELMVHPDIYQGKIVDILAHNVYRDFNTHIL